MKKVIFALGVCLAIAANAEAADAWVSCTPVDVASFSGRVAVRCSAATAGIVYFAIGTTDAGYAQRFTSIATAALVAGRTLSFLYDTADTTGTAFGCASHDCRRAKAVVLK